MVSVEKCALRPVALGLALLLNVAANVGCSGDDQLPALPTAPDAGADAPQGDGGLNPDGATTNADAAPVTANAGPDQAIEAGEQVTLTGQGRDPSGAAVSYGWTQISGATVVLDTPDRAVTTFTAPLATLELEFQLVVQSANGQSSDRVKVTVAAAPVLFVVNRGNNSVCRFAVTPELEGNVAPQATWLGARTRLRAPSALVVDNAGGFLASNVETNRITGFSNAFGPGGDVVPERYVGGPTLPFNGLEALAYDRAGDLLFVANFDSIPGTIHVFSDVSTPAFAGEVQPVARLQSAAIANPRDLELAPSGELYVVNAGYQSITVYANASAINGEVPPSRTISSPAFTNRVLTDAFLDSSNRLYVVGSAAGEILVFDAASGLTGNVAPTRTITVTTAVGALGFAGITLDAAGTGYVTDANVDAFYVLDDIASRSGLTIPDRIVTGAATGLSGPAHLSAVAP